MHREKRGMPLPTQERLCVRRDPQCVNSLQEQEADSRFTLSVFLPKCTMRPIWKVSASWCISEEAAFVYTCGIFPMKIQLLLIPQELMDSPVWLDSLVEKDNLHWDSDGTKQGLALRLQSSKVVPKPIVGGTCFPLPCPPPTKQCSACGSLLLLHK